MKVRFWGARGSFAMSGGEFLRYGGNTTSVELIADSGKRLLIDLGTGATEFAKELMAAEFGRGQGELPILLTHTHLDHIQGLPFFTPFFVKGNQIDIYGAAPLGSSLEDTIQTQLDPHYSPLYGLQNLAAGVELHTISIGHAFAVGDFEVTSVAVPHGGMWTTAYRVIADNRAIVFLSDVEYGEDGPSEGVLALAQDADLLIHDAMFTDDEYVHRQGWGHSCPRIAIELGERAAVRRIALFHHSPDATDANIDAAVLRAKASTEIPLFAAAEGSVIAL